MLGGVLKWLWRRGPAAPEMPTPPSPPEDRRWLSNGLQLQRLRRFREAGDLARSVLARDPDDLDALQLLAAALLALGDAKESLACLLRVAERAPGSAEVHVNVAAVLVRTGDHAGAIDAYRRALRMQPANTGTWSALALLLKTLGRYDEAEECCRSGLQSDTRHAGLRHVLSGALFEQGRVEEAIAEARASLEANPAAPAVHSDLLRMLNYSGGQDPAAVYREHLHWDESHARALTASAPPHGNDPDPHRRLRVGFVSPHFREHAMASFFESMVEHHDPKKLEIILYADVAQPDDRSSRLQAHGATWRNILGSSDARVADTVRNDAVDILVDLSGHTAHHRLLAFARRPAPVQVTWNGYPNTTGMAAMDYRITDARCDPPGTTEHLHTEKLVRLPSIYMSWRPPSGAPEPGPLPALRSGEITFGCFNSCFKITPAMARLWSRILHRVPRSRLMLLTVTGAAAELRIRRLFADNGIGLERLQILPRVPHAEFLAAHALADVALDTFPYHGTTTTCYSLWMGLPVVVREGMTHVSRVGVSMLTAVGVPRLIARSDDEYVEIAAGLAADLPALGKMRAELRGMMLRSPLTDGATAARELTAVFREMWTAWCRSREGRPREGAGPAARNIVMQSEYGPMMINRHDNMIGRALAEQGHWEKDEIELLRWFVKASYGTEREIELIDVGSYNGIYAIAFARFAFPKVTVHAFEAQSEIFQLLTETVALNRLDNVRCHHKAVSSESGQLLRFQAVNYDSPANFGSLEMESVTHPDFDGVRRNGVTETVETVRIDDLALNRVRLMKIDAEGMEHKVLAGAEATVKRCRPLIFLEYEKTDFDAVKSFLRAAGYRSYYAQRPNILCIPNELEHIKIEGAVRVNY